MEVESYYYEYYLVCPQVLVKEEDMQLSHTVDETICYSSHSNLSSIYNTLTTWLYMPFLVLMKEHNTIVRKISNNHFIAILQNASNYLGISAKEISDMIDIM